MLKKILFLSAFSMLSIFAIKIDDLKLKNIDSIVNEAIKQNKTAGAVVLVGIGDKIVYKKAFGYKSSDKRELMTQDTIFDIASLTKFYLNLIHNYYCNHLMD